MGHALGRDRTQAGFTLIELLVVLAVIAILMAVLLPALGRARASGDAVACASNMKQIALGWTLYTNANDYYMVPGQPGRDSYDPRNIYDVGNGRQYRPRWFALMGKYTDIYAFHNPSPDPAHEHTMTVDNKVYLCPTVPEWTNTRNYPYGYNYQFLGNQRFRGDVDTNPFVNFPVRVTRVTAPSLTVMFADSMGTAAGKPAAERTPNRPDGSRDPQLRAMGGTGYVIDPPRMTDDSDYADRRNRGPEHRSAPDERHEGSANVAFCDGHVKRMTLSEMGYHVNTDGSVAAWGKFSTNKFFSGTALDRDPARHSWP